jgi:hypothetical protein
VLQHFTLPKVAESLAAVAQARELSARLSAMDRLLLERTTELKAAQAFLTKADDVSEAELVGMVENLNCLISSASGALLVALDQEDLVLGTRVEDPDLKQANENLGSSTLGQVAVRNPTVITLAVQRHCCNFIERVTSGWGGGQAAWTLNEIYGMISTKGELRACFFIMRVTVYVHRESDNRIEVEDTDKTLHTLSRTASER